VVQVVDLKVLMLDLKETRIDSKEKEDREETNLLKMKILESLNVEAEMVTTTSLSATKTTSRSLEEAPTTAMP